MSSAETIFHHVFRPIALYTPDGGLQWYQLLHVWWVSSYYSLSLSWSISMKTLLCCLVQLLNCCSTMPACHSYCRKQHPHWLHAKLNKKVSCLPSSISALCQQSIILCPLFFIGFAISLHLENLQLYNCYLFTTGRPKYHVWLVFTMSGNCSFFHKTTFNCQCLAWFYIPDVFCLLFDIVPSPSQTWFWYMLSSLRFLSQKARHMNSFIF